MSRAVTLLALTFTLAACGGGPAASPAGTARSSPAAPTVGGSPAAASPGAGGVPGADVLCGLLTSEDWGQFNYVTAAQPEVTEEAPGSVLCEYAQNLRLEVYVDETAEDAADTYQTILENAPFEGGEEVTLPGADEAQLDMEITPETSGIVVRAGRVTFTVGGPARPEAEEQLKALATTVLGRISALR